MPMDGIKSKIAGSIFGFAIGDAMGATTEFMHPYQIKKMHNKVTELIGGGWLTLKPGEVTDDTQMTMCVMDAIMDVVKSGKSSLSEFGEACKRNFIRWYLSEPKDIGDACAKGILRLMESKSLPVFGADYNKNTLGNGSLMRAMPLAILGQGFEFWNVYQGWFTHNNFECSRVILNYSRMIQDYINGKPHTTCERQSMGLLEPSGHVWNTYNNAIYWSKLNSFEKAIIGAVNNGGDADTIAAITGSIAGARFGFEAIPQRWVYRLDSTVKIFLNKFVNFAFSYLQANKHVL